MATKQELKRKISSIQTLLNSQVWSSATTAELKKALAEEELQLSIIESYEDPAEQGIQAAKMEGQ